jgi:hypothetical protein
MDTICRGCGRVKEEKAEKEGEWVHRFGFDLCPKCWDRHLALLRVQRMKEDLRQEEAEHA